MGSLSPLIVEAGFLRASFHRVRQLGRRVFRMLWVNSLLSFFSAPLNSARLYFGAASGIVLTPRWRFLGEDASLIGGGLRPGRTSHPLPAVLARRFFETSFSVLPSISCP